MSSNTFTRAFYLSLLLFFVVLSGKSQIRCGTVEVEKKHALQNPNQETTDQFEQWMKGRLNSNKLKSKTFGSERTESITYTIPVVVHIIYTPGDAIGVRTNISDAQVQSQIVALNRDYPRLNADSVNTPAEFKSVAGKINMNFVLAQQDPEGVATNGITRTASTQASWTTDDETTYKALSYWPAENYLNLWVVNLVSGGVIGFAQLPQSSLGGLSTTTQNRLTDGVTINYLEFGDNTYGGNFNLPAAYNSGRTGTHEVGHIFGLRHIWGDVTGCTGTDYCDDTPNQDAPTSGCPAQPTQSCSPPHDKMFQNYMDYTDDNCYNLFTQDQIARMIVVLGNSPRRASLLVSPGANPPATVANDLGARKLATPSATACAGVAITPSVQVRNYGNNTITSTQIQFSLNGVAQETKNFTLNLSPLDTINLTFSALTLTPATSYQFTFSIISTNGGTDGDANNDALVSTVTAPATIALPFVEPFNSLPSTWSVVNPDAATTWQNVTAPFTSTTNTAMYLNFFTYAAEGQQDKLITPVFDLSTATSAILRFDLAYALYSASSNFDQLIVVVSTSCDTKNTKQVFNEAGAALATSATTTQAFTPKTAADWKTLSVDLTQFLGQSNVQISFIGINENGNNLYLDNISVVTSVFTDIAFSSILTSASNPGTATGLVSPSSPVICQDKVAPVVNIVNNGSTVVTSLTFSATLNSATETINKTFPDVQLGIGQNMNFTLDSIMLKSGTNKINIAVTTSSTDETPANNVLNFNMVSNPSTAVIPLRQNFDASYPDWSLVSPTQQLNWTSVTTTADRNLSLEYAGYSNTVIGSQGWVVSPTLDLSKNSKASLFFDLSYWESQKGVDELQILGSTDCGVTFPTVLFDQHSDSLAYYTIDSLDYDTSFCHKLKTPCIKKVHKIQTDKTAWAPQQDTDTDWKQKIYVNLDKMTGNSKARIAFVATNGNGNNLYIDNIEFFTDDSTSPLAIDTQYSIYNNFNTRDPKVTFNLASSETVHLQVIDIFGRIIIDNNLTDVLNQTFTLDMSSVTGGIYIVRLQIGTVRGIGKILVGN